ncbi:sulfate adenylyltransferase subunit CysN [Bordetella bronchialis]|uniref:sulfate adenylyltransferase subunit CysN n=1 Tax=Bordetella bronchialis TaxID=463025 RepID=UPI003CFE9F7E
MVRKHKAAIAPQGAEARALPPASIEAFIAQQQQQDLLRFITCGSVDDGKSTLIGRMLWDAQMLFDDQLASLKLESRKYGTQGEDIDFALLVDGLAAEREQGITIDVAYRFFATQRRKFIVADTPGHEQYTRNMVTGASTADVAVLLVDARHGILTQTRRHAYLVSLVGIRHVVVAVNKMDLVGYDKAVFTRIEEAFRSFAESLGFDSITVIPVSALKGDNITSRSAHTHWYAGPTLIGYLETVQPKAAVSDRFVFPVQWVNRPNSSFRGFSGTVAEGAIAVDDEVRVTHSGQVAKVAEIVTMDGALQQARAGQPVTLRLDREIDISRGDVLSRAAQPLETTDQLEATLVWMHEDAGLTGRTYDIKLATQWATCTLTTIKYKTDVNTLAHEAARSLALNDIGVCNIAISRPVAYDTYQNSRSLGSFILVDRYTKATVAAGMVRHTLRRAENVHRQAVTVDRAARERLNGHAGKVVWFTGLSGSGKSTVANALEIALHARGQRTYLLDGDNVRQGLNKDLGFTEADRVENIRRVAEVARLMLDAGLVVLTAFISPFQRERQMAREVIGQDDFVEVYVSTPLEVCEARDPKGLYKKARSGKLPNMSGIGSPYEPPGDPDIVIDASAEPVEELVRKLLARLGL